jgi:2-methylcitrate dehydratase PrpD
MENILTQKFVNFAADTKYEDLPQKVVHEAKRTILDTFGCALAALDTDKGKIAVQMARRMGGQPESTIIGVGGEKFSVWGAAFANAELVNALDYDCGAGPPHAPPMLIPPSLALAESMDASGKDLILSYAVGVEVSTRIASVLPAMITSRSEGEVLVVPPGHGHGCGTMGGAAGAGKILKLNREKMANAFGIAAYATPVPTTTRWAVSPPVSMTKYAFMGWISLAELTSALLAEMGYTGDTKVLDGDYGFWRFNSNDKKCWDPKKLVDQLGERWVWLTRADRMYKDLPLCGIYFTTLPELINLLDENQLTAKDIDSIKVGMALPVLDLPDNVWLNRDVRSHLDAQFSAPYLYAAAAHGVRGKYEWQDPKNFKDSRILNFMDRVSINVWMPDCPNMSEGDPHALSYSMIVTTKDGKTYKKEKVYTRDDSDIMSKGLTPDDELFKKFKENASIKLSQEKVDKAANLLVDLENVKNISELMKCVVP